MSVPVTQDPGRVCLVGCGYWGSKLAQTLASHGALAAVCDSDHSRIEALRERGILCQSHASLDPVLEDNSLRALVIAIPAALHFVVARAGLLAGKDVFVEKPLSLSVDEGETLVRIAAEKKLILMVGHLLLYHPAVVALKKMIDCEELGSIEYIYSNRLNLGRVRREENALWSFAPHDVSVVLHLIGKMPLQVTAVGGSYLQPTVSDVTVSTMLFPHGVRSHIFVSWLHPYKEQRLVVVGRKGMAVFDNVQSDKMLVAYDKSIDVVNGEFIARTPLGTPISISSESPLSIECRDFLDCVRTRRKPLTDGSEGLRVLHVLEACQRSLDLDGQPVEVRSLREAAQGAWS